MNIIEHIRLKLLEILEQNFAYKPAPAHNGAIREFDLALTADTAKQQFGDLSTNIALILAKQLGEQPRIIAQKIASTLSDNFIEKVEIAGPGFINIFLTQKAFSLLAEQLYSQKQDFFALPVGQTRNNYSIEFVSANPTGPLHIGHGRGGIIGDVLGNILQFIGHEVTKEFYINDAGAQITKLGISFKTRCYQQLGHEVALPEDAYSGEYLITLAQQCVAQHQEDILVKPEDFFAHYAKEQMLVALRETLQAYGITYDVWFSELILHKTGAIDAALAILESKNYLYTKDNALWFKSTAFGDDKDRVVKKNTGELTYVAADIAYLKHKIDRGFNKIIMVLGQDHHSYVIRLTAIMEALGYNPKDLSVILYQLVTLKESGQQLRMSKRAGRIVTLQDVIDTVGADVARFFYLHRKADAHLDFDLDLALKHTEENPVYYIQYAYVRTKSIYAKAQQDAVFADINIQDCASIGHEEAIILKKIATLKDLLGSISDNYQTHLLTYYTIELARLFHSYYGAHKVIDKEHIAQSRGRLLVILLIQQTFKLCFDLLGISAPEQM